MAITQPPIPPNTGNPAQLEERADEFFGWFPTFVSDFNGDLPLLRGRTYATRGGSANAITLNTGGVALATGMQVRWRAAAANTGPVTINVDGQGAIEARTITNLALPAGYIRTDVDTIATYDGARWIIERQIERGENANGNYMRLADGTQLCWISTTMVQNSTDTNRISAIWTFAAAFLSRPIILVNLPLVNEASFLNIAGGNNGRMSLRSSGAGEISSTRTATQLTAFFEVGTIGPQSQVNGCHAMAVGSWY